MKTNQFHHAQPKTVRGMTQPGAAQHRTRFNRKRTAAQASRVAKQARTISEHRDAEENNNGSRSRSAKVEKDDKLTPPCVKKARLRKVAIL